MSFFDEKQNSVNYIYPAHIVRKNIAPSYRRWHTILTLFIEELFFFFIIIFVMLFGCFAHLVYYFIGCRRHKQYFLLFYITNFFNSCAVNQNIEILPLIAGHSSNFLAIWCSTFSQF